MSKHRQLTKPLQLKIQAPLSKQVELTQEDLAQVIGGIGGLEGVDGPGLTMNHNETVVSHGESSQQEAQTVVELFEADLEVIVGGLNIIQLNHNETVVNDAEAVQEEAQTMVELDDAELAAISGGGEPHIL